MAGKLSLGTAGLAVAGGLECVPTFTPVAFSGFAVSVGLACGGAALLAKLLSRSTRISVD